MMRIAAVIAVLIAIAVSGCTAEQPKAQPPSGAALQPAPTPEPEPLPEPKAEELLAALVKAYESDSTTLLRAFFENWRERVRPVDAAKLEDEVVKDVYLAFREFYTPQELARAGKSEWGADIYKSVEYVIVQNRIDYRVGTEKTEGGEVGDFRPALKPMKAKPVYLRPAYLQALESFLGGEYRPMSTGDIMAPARAAGESKKRLEFLNRLVKIHHGHWKGWHIETHPLAREVEFNAKRTGAAVYFRIVYQGGEAKLEKSEGAWILRESALTWIE